MKRLLVLGIAAALVACQDAPTVPSSSALNAPALTVITPPGSNLLVCFDGNSEGSPYGGTCTPSADHKKAVLANTSSNVSFGDYAGVRSLESTVNGEYLSNITELSYTYKSSNQPALIPQLGNLSYRIPIDAAGDGGFDFFALIDAANCGLKSGANVNIVTMSKCGIVESTAPSSALPYPNWAAFVAAYPDAKVHPSYNISIIAVRYTSGPSATWEVSNVKFGKTGLICADGTQLGAGGVCTLGSDFKSATLDNTSNLSGTFSRIYSKERQAYGLFLSNIHDLTYKYKGPVPTSGDLRYLIPIDDTGDGNYDFFARVDASVCRGTSNKSDVWTVNITKDLACGIYDGSVTHPNWAAFAAAHPNGRVAPNTGTDAYMTIMAFNNNQSGVWSILDVKWGAKGK